ncbi:MAG TPA: tyrosine-type recombinase/integrase [Alphaproteobacteria bacterium]|nr:tyrosine-type recombinase/integrase [Alphaproteobacteria bacterium]
MSKQMRDAINALSGREVEEILRRIKHPVARIALFIMYFCGLSLSEVLQLRFDDIDFKAKILRVRFKRSDACPSERSIPIPDWLLHQIRSINIKSNYLFPDESGARHISIPTLQKALRVASIESGFKKQVSITALHHVRMLQLLEQGYNLENIHKFLGHNGAEQTF